jgi:octaprenyl-diphosphate synthase
VSALSQIQAPVEGEMNAFESFFKEQMKSEHRLLDKVTNYIVKRKGKQMRPLFVFLSAKLFEKPEEPTFVAATMIELLHTATLVHDDVVDDAQMRRGFFSINALWKNKIAVLVGDYLLSRGLSLSVKTQQFRLLGIMSKAVKDMAEGELLQQEKSRKLDITEEVYYDIIRQKTASLISACCESGAASTCATDEQVKQLALFGEYVGMAFQIKDDLFDYGTTDAIGKPVGIDIQERKLTLPLIHVLGKVDRDTAKKLIRIVRKYNTDKVKVEELMAQVVKLGGIQYATDKMFEFRDKALEILNQFEDSPARESLKLLVNYTIERKK